MSRLPVPGLSIESQPDDILAAMLVWGEARGEPHEGRLAVISVAINRAKKTGRVLRRIILAPWQFSSFNPDDPNREKLLKPAEHEPLSVWEACYAIAAAALDGRENDPTNGADHYCTATLWNNETPPGHKIQWYHRVEIEAGDTIETARIGRHVFAKAA